MCVQWPKYSQKPGNRKCIKGWRKPRECEIMTLALIIHFPMYNRSEVGLFTALLQRHLSPNRGQRPLSQTCERMMGQWVHRASMRRCERHTDVKERRLALQTARTRHRQHRLLGGKIMTRMDLKKQTKKVCNCSSNRQLFTELFITLESEVSKVSISLLMLRDRTNRWDVSPGTDWLIHPELRVNQTGPPWHTRTFLSSATPSMPCKLSCLFWKVKPSSLFSVL